MSEYILRIGTRTGQRVVDAADGTTVILSGRVLDNMSARAAEEVLALLRSRDDQRRSRMEGALRRNDLVAILDERYEMAGH